MRDELLKSVCSPCVIRNRRRWGVEEEWECAWIGDEMKLWWRWLTRWIKPSDTERWLWFCAHYIYICTFNTRHHTLCPTLPRYREIWWRQRQRRRRLTDKDFPPPIATVSYHSRTVSTLDRRRQSSFDSRLISVPVSFSYRHPIHHFIPPICVLFWDLYNIYNTISSTDHPPFRDKAIQLRAI